MKIINKALCGFALLSLLVSCKSNKTTAEDVADTAETTVQTAETIVQATENVAESAEEVSKEAETAAVDVGNEIISILLNRPWIYEAENQTLKFKLNGTCEYWENDSVAKCKYEVDKNILKITQITSLEKEGSDSWKGSFDVEEYFYVNIKENKLQALAFKKSGDTWKNSRLFWYFDKKTGEFSGLGRKSLVYTMEKDSKLNVKYDIDFAYNNSKAQEKHSTSGGTWKKSNGVYDLGGWGKYKESGEYLVCDSDYFFVRKPFEPDLAK